MAWVDQWASQVQATPQFSAKKSTEASDTGFLSPAYLKNIQSFLNFRAEQQDGLSDKKADIEAQIEELNSRVLVLDAEINGYSVQVRKTQTEQHNSVTINVNSTGGSVPLEL